MGPSSVSSSSLVPTFSPTSFVYKILQQVRMLDLPVSDPIIMAATMVGRNAVVVAESLSNKLYIIFYLLTNGEWVRNGYFNEHVVNLLHQSSLLDFSGRMALVGVCSETIEGNLYKYKQNIYDIWEKAKAPKVPHNKTNACISSLSLGSDLAAVFYQGSNYYNSTVHVFRHADEAVWELVEELTYDAFITDMVVEGDTITMVQQHFENNTFEIILIKYDPMGKKIEPLQDRLMIDNINTVYTGRIALSDYFLVHTVMYFENEKHEVFIYHRQDPTDPFTYLQYINASEFLEYPLPYYSQIQLALEKDVLVVTTPQDDKVLIFSFKKAIGNILFCSTHQ